MRTVLRYIVYALSIPTVIIIVFALSIFMRFDYYVRLASDRILANSVLPTAREMPQTTGPINYSSSYLTVLGGRGEGLSCSLPELAEWLAFPARENRQAIGLQMRQACATHDYCYRHGAATYGYTQADCDYKLQNEAFRLCLFIENANALSGRDKQKQSRCMQDARLVTLGVRLGGSDAFRTADPALYSADVESELTTNNAASTYFEYEQYPDEGARYQTYRLVRRVVAGKTAAAVYRFQVTPRGTYVWRASVEAQPSKYSSKSMLLARPEYIPSVPQVVRVARPLGWEDWLVWWQRYDFDRTGGRLVGIAPERATHEDWTCLGTMAVAGTQPAAERPIPECARGKDTLIVAFIGTMKHEDDNNFSEILPAHKGQGQDGAIRMMALATHSCILGGANAPCFIDIEVQLGKEMLFQHQEPLRVTDVWAPELKGKPQVERDRYRNYASMPFVFNPAGDERSALLWIRRDGGDYRSSATVRRLQSTEAKRPGDRTGISRGTVQIAGATELDEPFVLIGRKRQNPMLLSIVSKTDSPRDSRIVFSGWQLPGFLPPGVRDQDVVTPAIDRITNRCTPNIESTWLARPPVAFELADGGADLVLSRVAFDVHSSKTVLQIASLKIESDGSCRAVVEACVKEDVENLVSADASDAGSAMAERLKALRGTPLLIDDVNNDGMPEIVFPGAGDEPKARLITWRNKTCGE